MKHQRTNWLALAVSLTMAGGLATPQGASAQSAQPALAAAQLPAGYKIVLDNEHVRVFESTFAPGVVVPMRNYPRRTVYVIKGPAQMSTEDASGTVDAFTSDAGTVRSVAAGMQKITNVGTSDAVLLVVIDKRDLPGAK